MRQTISKRVQREQAFNSFLRRIGIEPFYKPESKEQ